MRAKAKSRVEKVGDLSTPKAKFERTNALVRLYKKIDRLRLERDYWRQQATTLEAMKDDLLHAYMQDLGARAVDVFALEQEAELLKVKVDRLNQKLDKRGRWFKLVGRKK